MYNVYDEWGDVVISFNRDSERTRWLKSVARWSGAHWLIYDLSHFFKPMTSRVLYTE